MTTHPELLLPVGGHETLLSFLGLGGFLHPLAHLSALAVDLGLLSLLRLQTQKTYFKGNSGRLLTLVILSSVNEGRIESTLRDPRPSVLASSKRLR